MALSWVGLVRAKAGAYMYARIKKEIREKTNFIDFYVTIIIFMLYKEHTRIHILKSNIL